eukprot:g1979.t1
MRASAIPDRNCQVLEHLDFQFVLSVSRNHMGRLKDYLENEFQIVTPPTSGGELSSTSTNVHYSIKVVKSDVLPPTSLLRKLIKNHKQKQSLTQQGEPLTPSTVLDNSWYNPVSYQQKSNQQVKTIASPLPMETTKDVDEFERSTSVLHPKHSCSSNSKIITKEKAPFKKEKKEKKKSKKKTFQAIRALHKSTTGRLFIALYSTGTTKDDNAKQFVDPTDPVIATLVEKFYSDTNLFNSVNRVFVFHQGASSLDVIHTHLRKAFVSKTNAQSSVFVKSKADVNQNSTEIIKQQHNYFRVIGYPRETTERILGHLLLTDKQIFPLGMSTQDPEHVSICAMNVENSILWGYYIASSKLIATLQLRANTGRKKSLKHAKASRAAYKILEVWQRRPTYRPSISALRSVTSTSSSFLALDIGSAPGGWSYELALLKDIDKVYSVDPGELLKPIPPKVIHFQKKVQDAIASRFKRSGDVLDNESKEIVKFDIVVCDMNAHPMEALRILFRLRNENFLRSGETKVIFTLKNFVDRGQNFVATLEECCEKIQSEKLLQNGWELLKLLSGGGSGQERTLVGIIA